MNRLLITPLLVAVLSLVCTDALAQRVARPSVDDPRTTVLRKSGDLTKAGTALAAALTEYETRQIAGRSILINARATTDGAALLAELESLGLQRGSSYGQVVSGLLPLAVLRKALALPELRAISASPPPITHVGSVTSQGDVGLRADIGRSAFGVDGTGVTVGIISDSFDTLGGAAADQTSGDLPAGGVTVMNGESTLCGTLVFCIDEGRAMAQIVHDLAPGADILFHSALDGIAAYASAIDSLATAGADVIVDDLLIVNEPMFQDGVVAQAIDNVVARGVSYFSAAGNSGRRSYESAFDDSGEILCIEFFEPIGDCDAQFERVGSLHDFDPGPGVDNFMHISVPVEGTVTIALQWDQPFGGAGPQTDHDVILLDQNGEGYVAISANDNIAMGEPWEGLRFANAEVLDHGTEFSIAISYDDVDSVGPPASLVKLVIFGEDVVLHEWSTNGSTLYGHGNARGAQTVGASFFLDTPEFGVSPPQLQPYSSAGGTPILFDTDGVATGTAEVRQKPDITAIDGVNTTFFFDDRHGNDGIDDFFGTSAAAPHAAAVAALLYEIRPFALPEDIRHALQKSAIDMGDSGPDFDSGSGLIQADAALAQISEPAPGRRAITTISDLNADGIDEIAVLRRDSVVVEVRDGQFGSLLRTLNYFDVGYTALSIAEVPDADDSGHPEIAVLATRDSDGRIVVATQNAAGVEAPHAVWFAANHSPVALAVVDDADGNGVAELAVLSRRDSDGRGLVEIKNAFGPTNTHAIWAGSGYSPHDLEVVPDADGNGTQEVAVLASRNSDGRIVVEVKNAAGATLPNSLWFAAGHTPIDLAITGDKDGNSVPEVAVLSSRDADGRNVVELKNAAGATSPSAVWFAAGQIATTVEAVNDADGNGVPEIAVLSTRESDGRILVEIKNSSGATNPRPLWYSPDFRGRDLAIIGDTDGNAIEEALVLMIRKSDGRVLAQGRNVAGAPMTTDYWFKP